MAQYPFTLLAVGILFFLFFVLYALNSENNSVTIELSDKQIIELYQSK